MTEPTLTQRTYLNSIASIVDYGSRLLISLLITPLLVSRLGGALYGVWQICQRLMNYMEATEGRPAQALKWTIANKQESDDISAKRRDVGSAIRVWIYFLPLQILFGGCLLWLGPKFMKTLSTDTYGVRWTGKGRPRNVVLRCKDESVGTSRRDARLKGRVATFNLVAAGSYEIECARKRVTTRVPGPEVTLP